MVRQCVRDAPLLNVHESQIKVEHAEIVAPMEVAVAADDEERHEDAAQWNQPRVDGGTNGQRKGGHQKAVGHKLYEEKKRINDKRGTKPRGVTTSVLPRAILGDASRCCTTRRFSV